MRIIYARDEKMDDPDRKAPSPSGRIALCLAHAIALGEDSFADWCGGRIRVIHRTGNGARLQSGRGSSIVNGAWRLNRPE